MKNTVHNDATSSNLKGKPMTKTIGLHWLQQVTKHVPATDEASVHRAQLRVKPLYYLGRGQVRRFQLAAAELDGRDSVRGRGSVFTYPQICKTAKGRWHVWDTKCQIFAICKLVDRWRQKKRMENSQMCNSQIAIAEIWDTLLLRITPPCDTTVLSPL